MKSTKIILFGATGMVGSRIVELFSEKLEIVSPSRFDVNLTSDNQIQKYLDKNRADYIVYAAGITRQDQAEEDKDLALKLNSQVPKLIAKIASTKSTPLVYFSTDAVFDGNKADSPYLEGDSVNPVNFYGVTKANGEYAVLSEDKHNLVLRLISVYTGKFEKKTDFVRRALFNLNNNREVYGISDLYFNPTFVDSAAFALLESMEKKASGILHIGSSDTITNYEFMKLIVATFKFRNDLLKPIKFKNFFKGHAAKRGQFTWLDTNKGQEILGRKLFLTNKQSIINFFNSYSKIK